MKNNAPFLQRISASSLDCPLSYNVYKFQPEKGQYAACCDADQYNFDVDLFEQLGENYFILDPRLIDRKKSLKDNIRHTDCAACWSKEDAGLLSMRQTLGFTSNTLNMKYDVNKAYPNRFELWMNSTCNLGCFMCHNGNSNTLRKIWYDVPDTRGYSSKGYDENHSKSNYVANGYKVRFEKAMIKFICDTLETSNQTITIAYLGGEPTLHSEMYDHVDTFIEAASKRPLGTTKIEIVTNGTSKDKLNERFYAMMQKYKDAGWITKIMLSQDGSDEYANVRHGADFEQIRKNYSNWIKSDSVIDEITSHTVLSNLNVPYIDKFADYICDTIEQNFGNDNTKLTISFNTLIEPEWMKILSLPKTYAEEPIYRAIERFKKLNDKYTSNLFFINIQKLQNVLDILPEEISQEEANYVFEKCKYVANRYKMMYNGWDMFETFPHMKQFAYDYGIDLDK